MKMAKASEADLNMAMELCGFLGDIDRRYVPERCSEGGEGIEFLDTDDGEQCSRIVEALHDILQKGSINRVVWGMAVVCDPANECIDPAADTIEHHPKRQLLEQQRDDAVSQAAAVNEQFIEISRQRDLLLEALEFARQKIAELHIDAGDDDCHYPIIDDAITAGRGTA